MSGHAGGLFLGNGKRGVIGRGPGKIKDLQDKLWSIQDENTEFVTLAMATGFGS
jgi:hypothetical protein